MTSHDDHAQDTAKAMLALGLSRDQADFRVPSDEELAQMLDPQAKSGLDATRQAQIMDAIANDPATFSRWMAAVEMAETLGIGNFAADAAFEKEETRSSETTLFSRIASFVSEHLGGVMATGGAAAMAMGLAIVFMLPVGMDSQVSRLYDDYGNQWTDKPQQLDMIRGAESADSQLSAADQRLQQGIQAGLERLGEDFRIRNLNTASNTDTTELDAELNESLYALGQIAAMSHFKCSLGAEEAYYETSWRLINELALTLRKADNESAKALTKVIDRQGKAETQVCRVSKAVVARVTQ